MKRFIALLLALAASSAAGAQPAATVISLNLCTDQLVLALAEPSRLLGLSPFARDIPRSGTVPLLSGTAEEVLLAKPDLVVAGRWDRPATLDLIRRRGLRLETFDIPRSIAEAKAQVARMGAMLGADDRARTLNARIDDAEGRLRAAARRGLTVLPYSRRGWVEGGSTMLGAVLLSAGLANAADAAGLGSGGFLSLEALLQLRPDAILVARNGAGAEDQGSALLRHPVVETLFPPARRLPIADPLTVCGGPALAAAMDDLAARIATLEPRRQPD